MSDKFNVQAVAKPWSQAVWLPFINRSVIDHRLASKLLLSVFLALLAVVAASTTMVSTSADVLDTKSVVTIQQAEFCNPGQASDAIPGLDCGWQTVELPKLWGVAGHRHALVDAWFKVSFRLSTVPEDGISVFATAYNRSGRIFANSIRVRAVGSMIDPLPLNWNRGQYFVIPASMLRTGSNEIQFQVRQYSWEEGALGVLKLGPEEKVRPLWEDRRAWQNDAVEVLGAMTAAIGLVMIGVWLLRRSEKSYFWFGCTCFVWSISNLDFFIASAPVPAQSWDKFILAANVLRALCIYMFTLRYCNRHQPWLETFIGAYFSIGTFALFIGPFSAQWVQLWFLGPLVFGTPYFGFLLVRESLKRDFWEGRLMAVAVTMDWLFSGYDAWLYSQNLPAPIFLAHYSTPLYVALIAINLVRHFVSSLRGYEQQHAIAVVALDEAKQATKDKNLFLSMVSHELKSPLQSIITVLATEDSRAPGKERRESLAKIRRAVKHMEAQIRDLFVLSAGESAQLEMRSETFEVGELVDEVVASVRDLANGKSIRIVVARTDGYLFVATDPKRVEQILLNLVENAVKYTQAGTVTITYSLQHERMLCLEVADTGDGIAQEHIGKLFVPYRRFGLLERNHNSLGIGLAVVQTLLTHLGGVCEVKSTLGTGSTFNVRIPVAVETEQGSAEISDDAIRVLIVDDRPEMLADLREVARTLEYHVDTALNAPQASNLLAIAAFDLVLIDLDMPVKNGYELASEIRRGEGPNTETCLIAISAGSRQSEAFSAGWPFDSFEQKPIDARAMKRIVETRRRYRPS